MLQRGLQRQNLSCPICLEVLKEPVTIPCGHSYCRACISINWDGEEQRNIYRCPVCSDTFTSRPVLKKNTVLAALVEEMRNCRLDLASAAAESTERQKELQEDQAEIQDKEKDIQLFEEQLQTINLSANQTVEHSQQTFTELIRLLHRRSSELEKEIRSKQQTEVSAVRALQEKLEQEISDLKKGGAELQQDLSVSTLSPVIHTASFSCFQEVTAAVSQLREHLHSILTEDWNRVCETGEPMSRAGFLLYSKKMTFDPNTAHRRLGLSEENRKVTVMENDQPHPDHPDRFTMWRQVLSRESLTGRCYWEVEVRGTVVGVGLAYKSISRAGEEKECGFGFNDKSWMLQCSQNDYTFIHDNIRTEVSGPPSSRIGVYVDYSAGILSFYSVRDTMTRLHQVHSTFTEPLYAGVWGFYLSGGSAELCKL